MGIYGNDGTYHAYRSSVPLPLTAFRAATSGDVGNLVAHGGQLASDSTPALAGAGSTIAQQLSWVASNSTQILCAAQLPPDFNGADDVLVELWVASGTTDAATFTVLTNWDGAAADVSDTATDGAKSATVHKITAVISAADIPDSASFVSIALTPAAHTTNAVVLANARLTYLAKSVS